MAVVFLASCAAGSRNSFGGEVTGIGSSSWVEPNPYGMVLVSRGSIKAGPQEADSIWGVKPDARGVSVGIRCLAAHAHL